ncbi:MAG: hypothetical protein IJW46_00705, partial [Clostridia bacterium]|nr:hypothetical protein [Clostridia bacterium]
MALQLLFSNWWENETEHTLRIMSQGISDADVEYILHTVSVTDNYESLPEDEENADLANTLYLRLPSSAHAIVRTGTYTVENSMQTANIIVHAFIAEEGEEITPLLYAINNCFRTALTQEEQTQLRQTDYLPASPLPRPQFKLSQAEIRKFFSQGRLRTLASLLQAVIDSHDNQRIILLNDSYPSLKYWFYGIHTCLPKNITSSLTYCTYAFNKPDDCILICTAPNHTIDLNEDIEEGNFVIDNIGENGCHDIEAAQFASYVVHQFWDDAASIKELTDSLEDIMNTYSLNIATAAGLLKLIEFDFNWFASAYDIHYYLGKVSTIDKSVLEVVSQKLWEAFFSPDFKFDIGVDTLPLLAYIFRNTDDEVKWQIIHHIDTHKEKLGYRTFETFELLYLDLIDRLSFVTEFIPFTLIESQTLADYCKVRDPHPSELTAFLYIIVDNYKKYSALLEPEILNDQTLYLFERLLGSQKTDLATEVVKRATHLPYDFLRYVVIQGILNSSNDKDTPDDTELHLSDTFVYSIARLLIEKDNSLALELVKNHARKGKYHDSTLALYIDLLADFPEETADFDDTLKAKAVYADFVTDSIFYKFASLQNASTEELTDFFRNYYLTGEDWNHYFETKLLQHLQESLPVCSIETADYFLKL